MYEAFTPYALRPVSRHLYKFELVLAYTFSSSGRFETARETSMLVERVRLLEALICSQECPPACMVMGG